MVFSQTWLAQNSFWWWRKKSAKCFSSNDKTGNKMTAWNDAEKSVKSNCDTKCVAKYTVKL